MAFHYNGGREGVKVIILGGGVCQKCTFYDKRERGQKILKK